MGQTRQPTAVESKKAPARDWGCKRARNRCLCIVAGVVLFLSDLDFLVSSLLDPRRCLVPSRVELDESGLASSLDELVGLGDQLVGQQPRVRLRQLRQHNRRSHLREILKAEGWDANQSNKHTQDTSAPHPLPCSDGHRQGPNCAACAVFVVVCCFACDVDLRGGWLAVPRSE